jgi:hypothetical protein
MKNDILTTDLGIKIYDRLVDFLFIKNREHFIQGQYCQDCTVSEYNNQTASTFDLEVVVVNLEIQDIYFDILKPEFYEKFNIGELLSSDEIDWEEDVYVEIPAVNIMVRIRLPYSDDKYLIDVNISIVDKDDYFYWRDTVNTNVSLLHELDNMLNKIMKIEKSSYINI